MRSSCILLFATLLWEAHGQCEFDDYHDFITASAGSTLLNRTIGLCTAEGRADETSIMLNPLSDNPEDFPQSEFSAFNIRYNRTFCLALTTRIVNDNPNPILYFYPDAASDSNGGITITSNTVEFQIGDATATFIVETDSDVFVQYQLCYDSSTSRLSLFRDCAEVDSVAFTIGDGFVSSNILAFLVPLSQEVYQIYAGLIQQLYAVQCTEQFDENVADIAAAQCQHIPGDCNQATILLQQAIDGIEPSTQWWTLCVSGEVSLSLGSTPLANNSVVLITDIGDAAAGGLPLICTTTFRPRCSSSNRNPLGQWHYPDDTMVDNSAADGDFYRNRGDDGTVRLHRRNGALSPTGTYYCEIPGNSTTDLQRLAVRVISVSLIPSGTPTAGAQYQLNCSRVTRSTDTPTFTWLGPPSNTPLPSDSRMVSGVMSSGSTHTSILQFDPIQSSHEGMYTCQVTVGTVTEMRSTQVNVEVPVVTAMVNASGIPTVGQSYSLTCTVTGADRLNPTITYQWFKDNTVVSGETQSTLSFSSLSLSDAEQYRCDATVSSTFLSWEINSQGEHEIRIRDVVFQIRLNGILSCLEWVSGSNADTTAKSSDIISTLVQAVEQACECWFTRGHITEDAFQCFPESQQHVTFRARLTETSQATTPQLITYIEQWVSTTQTITIQSVRLGINNTCDIVIEDFNSPECQLETTTMAPPPSGSPITGAIAGATVGVVLAALAVIAGAVIAIVCVLKKRRKTYQTTSKSQIELSPVSMEAVLYEPTHEYEDINKMTSGELYEEIGPQQQTTEYTQCPAYAPTTTAVTMATRGEPRQVGGLEKKTKENEETCAN